MKTVKLSRTLTAVLALLLALCLSLPLTACGGENPTETATGAGSETVTEAARDTDTATGQTVDKNLNVNVAVLSGTTGFGMAQLMEQSSKGASALKYTFRVESDASNILPALLNGSVDIAALPTNAAANLYAKKAGAVQVLAVNTLGVLYVVTGEGVSVSSFEDLKGKRSTAPRRIPPLSSLPCAGRTDWNRARTSQSTTPMHSPPNCAPCLPPEKWTSPSCRSRW